MKRVHPISKLFRKTKKSDPVATSARDAGDVNSSPVASRGANVPTVLGVVKTGVKVANAASSLWPPLQAITSILEYFINNHEAWLKNQKATIYLVDRLKGLEKFIYEGGVSKIYDRFSPKIRQLERDLQEIKNKATANRYLASSEIADALNEIVKDIGDVILDYQTYLQKAILDKITQQTATDDQKIIQAMHRAPDANHLSEKHTRCLSGTRTNILLDLEAWARASDPMTPTVYWLNGIAGSGKSTISQSFCHQAFADGRLGASFFCSRDTEARSDLDMIFPTLSFQLACRFPEIRSHIVEVLKSRPDVAKESLINQLEALLLGPLEQSSLSTLIVIDALDECKDNRPTSIILTLLSQHIQRIPRVKWFITGRPEPPLRQGFRTPGLQPITKTFILHDVTASDVDHDISFYLVTHLSKDFKQRSKLHLPEIWPPDDEIQALTIKCEQLFIFASTAVTYIRSPYHHPATRLSSLCRSKGSTSEHGRLGLDRLYTIVLEVGYGDASAADHESIMAVIASVVLAFNPIPVDELAKLLNIEATTIIMLLRMLHAVLRVPQSNDRPITLYHKSFFDYITDASRCMIPKFHVDPSIQHCMLADRCLGLMNSHLRRNLCSLPRYAMNSDLELTERQRRIGGALVYACSSWAAHLTLAKMSANTLKVLGEFLKNHLIHWMEVMSLIDEFTSAIRHLHDIHNFLIAMTNSPENGNTDLAELLEWVYDGKKLASEFREPVQMSASHIYHSALPLSPEGSLLRQSHSAALKSEVKILHGNISKWSLADMTISLPSNSRYPRFIFSHNGKLLAIKDGRGRVYIYDVTTGQYTHEFKEIGNICFAPDDTLIASSRWHHSVLICDLRTGAQDVINPSIETTGNVFFSYPQAFSPGGQFFAIGGANSLIIWNISSGEREWEIKGDFRQLEWLQEDPPSLITRSEEVIQVLDLVTDTSDIIYQRQDATSTFYLSLKHGLMAIEKFHVHDHTTRYLYLMGFKSRQILHTFKFGPEGSYSFAFSSLEPLIACGGQFFDITNPTNPQPIPTIEPMGDITFSPTQHIFAICRQDRIELIPTTRSHFLLPIGSPIPSFPPFYSHYFPRERQLFVSSDGSKVILITGKPTDSKLLLDKAGVTKTVVDVQYCPLFGNEKIWIESMPPKLKRAFQVRASCLTAVPGLSEMEALGVYWKAPRLGDVDGRCCFATPNTLVFVVIDERWRDEKFSATMNLMVYSLDKEKIMAEEKWDLGRSARYIGNINMDTSTGALIIFTPQSISGAWRVVKAPAGGSQTEYPVRKMESVPEPEEVDREQPQDTTFSHTLAPIPSNTLLRLDSDLREIYGNHSSRIQYPVLSSDNGQWIMNHIGQHILWVPYRIQTWDENFRLQWRWCQERLFLASNSDSEKGLPDLLIVDFVGVDVMVPTALQVFEKLGWNRIVITDLARLEDDEDSASFTGQAQD